MQKKIAIQLEETHPLGRMYDIDIFNKYGKKISRTEIGREERKCYICNDKAIFCCRAQKHSIKTLEDKIEMMISEYQKAYKGLHI